jgi:hypothetical protein
VTINPLTLSKDLFDSGQEKARTRAYAATTDRLRKQVRAGIMARHINQKMTIARAEAEALTDPEYIQACERAEQAQMEAGIAEVHYASIQATLEVWRTMEATHRAEMQIR